MRASIAALVALAGALLAGVALAGDLPEAALQEAPERKLAPTRKASSIAEAWRLLPAIQGHGCADDLVFDYGEQGGMRNFFCRALTVFSWKTFLSLAPTPPFRAGPHKKSKLNLHSAKDFGRYDPAFVKWATTALVPAATDEKLRQETQPHYDRFVRDLARTYYRVHRALWADKRWVLAERKVYLAAADRGDIDALGATLDLYHDILGTAEDDWGGHDPNHVRSATTWWLRRSHDDTAELWAEGLERLLSTYDRAWLESEKKRAPRALPQRPPPPAKPEYR